MGIALTKNAEDIIPSLVNPFDPPSQPQSTDTGATGAIGYETMLADAHKLRARPQIAGGARNISRKHLKNQMTVWERISVLTDCERARFFGQATELLRFVKCKRK